MQNILLYSDLHISQSSLKECILILEEIGMLANKFKIDTLINLGDTFDSIKPNSQELDIFANFIRRLGTDKQHIILAANSHESESEEISILNHYGILSDNVKIVKEYIDNNHLYCGHFSIKESSKNYDAKLSKIDLKQYRYVFLGHIHSFEKIKPNICHLGSARYVHFDEAKDKQKVVAIIADYQTDKERVYFQRLNSTIPMQQLYLSKNNQNVEVKQVESTKIINPGASGAKIQAQTMTVGEITQYLDKLDPKNKIKVIIQDFESYRTFLPLEWKYKEKFVVFKRENDFELVSDNRVDRAKSETNLKQSFEEFAKEKNVNSDIKKIIEGEIQ